MLSTRPVVEPSPQLEVHKNASLALLVPGDVVELVFKKDVSYEHLVGLQALEVAEVILLSDSTKGAISLLLTNKRWGELSSARRFRVTMNKPSLDLFRTHLPVKFLEEVTKLKF